MFVDEKRLYIIPTQTASSVLIEAARLIETQGHSQTGHRYGDGSGPLCPVEAIGRAAVRLNAVSLIGQAHRAVERLIGKPERVSGITFQPSIVTWNEGQSAERVSYILRLAACS